MKTKNIPILFFILLFTGAILLVTTQAMAQVDATDCECTFEEISLQACYETPQQYVIQPYFSEAYPDPIAAGKWPIIDPVAGTKEWRYKICSNATKKQCKSIQSWNYFVYVLPWQTGENSVDYYLESIPPGASLLLPGDLVSPKCKGSAIPNEHDGIKVNPSVNCGDEVGAVTSIFTNLEPQMGYCLEAYTVLSQDCIRTDLRGPGFDVVPPEPVKKLCDNRLVVRSHPCTLEILEVTINGVTANESTNAEFCAGEPPWDVDDCWNIGACGSGAGGCHMCGDKPIFIDGGTVYY